MLFKRSHYQSIEARELVGMTWYVHVTFDCSYSQFFGHKGMFPIYFKHFGMPLIKLFCFSYPSDHTSGRPVCTTQHFDLWSVWSDARCRWGHFRGTAGRLLCPARKDGCWARRGKTWEPGLSSEGLWNQLWRWRRRSGTQGGRRKDAWQRRRRRRRMEQFGAWHELRFSWQRLELHISVSSSYFWDDCLNRCTLFGGNACNSLVCSIVLISLTPGSHKNCRNFSIFFNLHVWLNFLFCF